MSRLTKIVHICLASFYIDRYSYQENLLPKWHKKLGYDVEIIASLQSFDSNGVSTVLPGGEQTYVNEYGIKTTRIDYKFSNPYLRKLRYYDGLNERLNEAHPDIIFIHGLQFGDMGRVVQYVRNHPGIKVFVDNHADYSNSAKNWFSKCILHRIIWKRAAKCIEPFTTMFWGVLPARVDFLVENYGLPRGKCDLLVMGADDEEVDRALAPEVRATVRSNLDVSESDYLIVTGGKIDAAKTQVLKLMDAVKRIAKSGKKVKLLVFGTVVPELKEDFFNRVDDSVVKFVGWADTSKSYDYFSASDLVCFPGRHSVYWEQVAAMGRPMVIKRWEGTTHVDIGGNVRYLYEDKVDEICSVLNQVMDPPIYAAMAEASQAARSEFLYSHIARKSIAPNYNK